MSSSRRSAPLPLLILSAASLVALLGVVGFLVHRNLSFELKPTTPEVKSNLHALYSAEKAYFAEKDGYREDMRLVGFLPAPGNRYSYFSAPQGRALSPTERKNPTAPYHVIPADPEVRRYRGGFTSFAETGCPLTSAVLPDGTQAGLGVTPAPGDDPSQAVFIAAAAANIDDDGTVDCWSIATVDRVAADGAPIPAGMTYNELSDVAH
jgi:type IV pilus assembly protein PilA